MKERVGFRRLLELAPSLKTLRWYHFVLACGFLAYAVFYLGKDVRWTGPEQSPPVPVSLEGDWVGLVYGTTPVRLVFEDSANGMAYFQYPEGTIVASVGVSPGYPPPRQSGDVTSLFFLGRMGQVFEWRGTILDSVLEGRWVSGFTDPVRRAMVFTRVSPCQRRLKLHTFAD